MWTIILLIIIGFIIYFCFKTNNEQTAKNEEYKKQMITYIETYFDPIIHDINIFSETGQNPYFIIANDYDSSPHSTFKHFKIQLLLHDTILLGRGEWRDSDCRIWDSHVKSVLYREQEPKAGMFYQRELWVGNDHWDATFTNKISYPYFCDSPTTINVNFLGDLFQERYTTKYPALHISFSDSSIKIQ